MALLEVPEWEDDCPSIEDLAAQAPNPSLGSNTSADEPHSRRQRRKAAKRERSSLKEDAPSIIETAKSSLKKKRKRAKDATTSIVHSQADEKQINLLSSDEKKGKKPLIIEKEISGNDTENGKGAKRKKPTIENRDNKKEGTSKSEKSHSGLSSSETTVESGPQKRRNLKKVNALVEERVEEKAVLSVAGLMTKKNTRKMVAKTKAEKVKGGKKAVIGGEEGGGGPKEEKKDKGMFDRLESEHNSGVDRPVAKKSRGKEPVGDFKGGVGAIGKQPVTKKSNVRTAALSTSDRSLLKMQEKLHGSRFRWLNEQLYTCTGKEAYRFMQKDPNLFEQYHQGFESQVQKWPINPVDIMIGYLTKRPVTLRVADFGCGDARLARSVPQKTVHSFDLVSANEHVVACDMANVPLKPESVDIAIFCLSLMGINYVDYLREAHRVLVIGGLLKIAEVSSRIDDVDAFVSTVENVGFRLMEQNATNKFFIQFTLRKTDRSRRRNEDLANQEEATVYALKPCLYKKR